MSIIDGVAVAAICGFLILLIVSLIKSGRVQPSRGKALRALEQLLGPRETHLPEGIEELVAPTVRDHIEALFRDKFDACKQAGGCDTCRHQDNDPEIVSRCGFDRIILTTLAERTSTEQELWKDVNLTMRTLLVELKWAKEDLLPVLEETRQAFGKQAWRNRWFITSVLSNIGTIGTVIWWAVTTILGGG